ncbi:hypothetical protein LZF95_15475 [Algoriphagus sp. AGSA1]|uniref:hypothetical protein n=1 Tax=Algoriphagus sp. AGSA1 TaxID=2907213 RepID=UPI001F39FA12|nr:hypothetical protein [Algoriphagus sp. AGSA1]MCE7056082.1 hypothetical protein [Algoriphagus sp. AGSA1]
MSSILNIKRIKVTVGILASYLSMMILIACVDDPEVNPFGECGGPVKANATDVSLFYEPYSNNRHAIETDTVSIEDFNVYLRLAFETFSQSSHTGSFPGRAYALSCAPNLNFQNIEDISMILLESYGNIEAGTDISNLVTTHDDIKISDLKDFTGSTGLYRLTIAIQPENKSQLKTKTILQLKNGSEKIVESTSPVLLTN